MKKLSLDQLAKSCVEEAKNGQLTFLTGAGVSMVSPSRLPSGHELKVQAVKGVCASPGLTRLETKVTNVAAFQALVPEVLFQRLYDCFGAKLFSLFDGFKNTRHNISHEMLVRIGTNFSAPILTTNFDGLLEAVRGSGRTNILHLHGELANPHKMVIRLHQIGRGLDKKFERLVGREVRGRCLCVLGYSGNDEDIRLIIKKYEPAKILWLVRNRNDRAIENVERFFSDFNVFVAPGSLERFTNLVTKSMRWHAHHRTARRKKQSRKSKLWRPALSSRERYAALSEALLEVRQYRLAAKVAIFGAKICPFDQRPSWFHVQAAEAYRILSDTRHALRQASQAVAVSRKHGDGWDQAAALNALGLVHLERAKTNPRFSKKYFRLAERKLSLLSRSEWNERVVGFAARLQNNIGLAEMEVGAEVSARKAFYRSLRLKRRVGDLVGQGTTAANLAVLCAKHGRWHSAMRWRRHALLLISRYDQKFRAAYIYRRLGTAFCESGEVRRGLSDLYEALRIYEAILGKGFETRLTLNAIAKYR